MAVAAFTGGLLSYDKPERDSALPEDVRASVPDTSADGDTPPAKTSPGKAGAHGTPAPQAPSDDDPRPTPTKNPSPSPSRTSPSPSAPTSAPPPQSSPGASPSEGTSVSSANEVGDQGLTPKVLRLGDHDPEVTELQFRLNQLGFYFGDYDQNFDAQVQQAVIDYQTKRRISTGREERGVYGLSTRAELESETTEP